jgi:thioredoxin-like negative regulator of GroEL
MIAPIIEELAREYSGKVVFGKLDVDKSRAVSKKYQNSEQTDADGVQS